MTLEPRGDHAESNKVKDTWVPDHHGAPVPESRGEQVFSLPLGLVDMRQK